MKLNVMNFLKQNVKPATGCTEPISVAYATALAYHALFEDLPKDFDKACPEPEYDKLKKISIKTDRDVYKNALAINIPGTKGQKGMAISSAMGFYCSPKKGLNLFEDVNDETISKANEILDSKKLIIEEIDDASEQSALDIEVKLEYFVDGAEKSSYVRIQHEHDNITEITVNGKSFYKTQTKEGETVIGEKLPKNLEGLVDIVKNLTSDEKDEIYKGIEMNKRMAEEGLTKKYGIEVGRKLQELIDQGTLQDDLVTAVRIKAAAAGDARMGGANMPVMSTAGSGNQGITALIPILVIGEKYNFDKDKQSEAAMLSHLVTKYISNHSGYLSAICGCAIKAGVGAAAGATYLLGGDVEQINNAINIMAANITGMICDGAKEGCALKLSTAAGTATESALMAMNGMKVPNDNGIISEKAEETMKSIGIVTKSMVPTDIKIVDIMQNKDKPNG